jgi:hypothetical protein
MVKLTSSRSKVPVATSRDAHLLQLYPSRSRTTPACAAFAVNGQPRAWTRCALEIMGGEWGAGWRSGCDGLRSRGATDFLQGHNVGGGLCGVAAARERILLLLRVEVSGRAWGGGGGGGGERGSPSMCPRSADFRCAGDEILSFGTDLSQPSHKCRPVNTNLSNNLQRNIVAFSTPPFSCVVRHRRPFRPPASSRSARRHDDSRASDGRGF